jgi:electron transfer flavoprotein beta subunit
VESWTLQNLGIPPEWVGFKGSPTVVRSMKTIKEKERSAKRITIEEIGQMVKELSDSGVLKMEVKEQ